MSKTLKELVQAGMGRFGYQFTKLPSRMPPAKRPVGSIACFLEDVRAKGFQPRSILDVGANKGNWTRMAQAIFPEASFIMIEPQEEMRPFLEGVTRDLPKTRFIQAGAGPVAGELTLTVWSDLEGSSFLPGEDTSVTGDKPKRVVPIVTIDSLYDQKALAPDLVKLDIQGFELEALKGGQSLFGQTELFILEVSLFHYLPNCPLVAEVVAFMAQRGYEVYDFPGFLRRDLDGALGQTDIAFARKKGFLRASNEW